MKIITSICQIDPDSPTRVPVHLDYKMTLRLIDQLKACDEIAASRTSNWQTFCHTEKSKWSLCVEEQGICVDDDVCSLYRKNSYCAMYTVIFI